MLNNSKTKILITGGAGFIGSNLCEFFLNHDKYQIVCLDNLSTGFIKNISSFLGNSSFEFIEGDIRDFETCKKAIKGCDYVLHQAALGSVPRSINDPITTNDVNISGFLNIIFAAKEEKIKRFVFAASSSTYGDSQKLPKIEDEIGKPLSPYAITKYVNELYAEVFSKLYGIEVIGLRYFNVFGRRQDPNGAYAAVIPKLISQFVKYESPIINGDGNFSRDFTYIDNVLQLNHKALFTTNPKAVNQIYNTAVGERTTLNQLVDIINSELVKFDSKIGNVKVIHGPNRLGDIPHSLASIEKARKLLNFEPSHNLKLGIEESIKWYWENLK